MAELTFNQQFKRLMLWSSEEANKGNYEKAIKIEIARGKLIDRRIKSLG